MSLADEITKAIGAHGMWKTRLRRAIETGKSEFSAETLAKDNLCDFGKWLYGATLTAADKAAPDYQSVKSLHAHFHQAASKVLKKALSGNRAEGETLVTGSGEFATVSADLTRAMTSWKGKVSK